MIQAWLAQWGMKCLIVVALCAGSAIFGAMKMHEIDRSKHDAFVAGVQQLSAVDQAMNDALIQRRLKLNARVTKDLTEQNTELVSQLLALNGLFTDSSREAAKRATAPTGGTDNRTCYDSRELTAGVEGSMARLRERLVQLTGKGAQGLILAQACKVYLEGVRDDQR